MCWNILSLDFASIWLWKCLWWQTVTLCLLLTFFGKMMDLFFVFLSQLIIRSIQKQKKTSEWKCLNWATSNKMVTTSAPKSLQTWISKATSPLRWSIWWSLLQLQKELKSLQKELRQHQRIESLIILRIKYYKFQIKMGKISI